MMSSPSGSMAITDLKAEAINVVVRCRGRSDREIAAKSDIVVDVPDRTGSKEVSINTSNDSSIVGKIAAKTFTVDQVFGPSADQELVFQKVAEPLFDDFLKGFNCTIFAYGQTGTGKTHTMCGDDRTVNGSYCPGAGIIPRILFKLFENLGNNRKVGNDYVIKCSLVEIYNETLKDLLNFKSKKELRIYEEQIKTIPGKPDKSAVFIKDLEEYCVRDAMEGLDLLRKGLIDRKTASTNMNKSSSRSHTIFGISLYKKDGDNLYRYSKMNLVDLAGSENISRSGATDMQAKEAGSINRSLLSLGKVINALVDNNLPPYRDSKLTRLLKDSLGGETKTVLIANISPSHLDSDETSKTLEYASKAKNVMNTPQVGNLMLKHVVVKDLVDEVSRLRRDLISCWSKDGVMIDKENYEQMRKDLQHYKIQVDETNRKLEFQQNQNKILNHDLNSKMNEVVLMKEKINEMQQVNSILNGKVQKQQNSERMLYDSTKRYKELMALFNGGVDDFKSYQQSTNAFLKDKIHNTLEIQSKKLVDVVEESLKTDINVETNTDKIKMSIEEMIKNFQKSAFEVCDNATNSLTSKLPVFFDDLKQEVNKSLNLSQEEFDKLNDKFANLKKNNNKFENYLSQNLFNNHDELLNRHIEAMNTQNESNKKEFLSKFMKLFENHYNNTITQIPSQMKNLRQQIIDSEKDLLAGKKYDWSNSNQSQIQDSELILKNLKLKINDNNEVLKNKIDHLNNVTCDSKIILEDERKKITEMVNKVGNNEDVISQLNTINNKFKAVNNIRQNTMNDVLTIVENISNTSDQAVEKSKLTFTISQQEKISQLINTIEKNEKMIDSTISIPKSRNVSPIRQITPRRESFKRQSPARSISRSRSVTKPISRPISRPNSRSNSRQSSRQSSRSASPVKMQPRQQKQLLNATSLTGAITGVAAASASAAVVDDNNKENINTKRKVEYDDNDDVGEIRTQSMDSVRKKMRSLPSNIKSKQISTMTNNRRPFR